MVRLRVSVRPEGEVRSFRYDEFLQCDPADFNGIRRLNLPSKLIWLPDIVLYNVSVKPNERTNIPRQIASIICL